jgi:hypothetical protein
MNPFSEEKLTPELIQLSTVFWKKFQAMISADTASAMARSRCKARAGSHWPLRQSDFVGRYEPQCQFQWCVGDESLVDLCGDHEGR